MNDHQPSRDQLLEEVRTLRARLADLEQRGPTGDAACQRTLEELRANEELHQRIIEAVPGGVVQVAPDGSILTANAEARRMLGLTADDLSRRRVHDFAPLTVWEDGSPCPVADYPVSKCLQTGLPQPPTTIGVRRPDGQVTWGIYAAVPLRDALSGQ